MTAPSDFGSTPTPSRRVLPHSMEAERSVLGGMLLSAKAYRIASDRVKPDDFYHPAHKAIYEAMIELDEASRPIDAITVAEQMRAKDTFGKLRAVNGEAYLVELMTEVVTVENIAFHAKMVAGKATVRRLIEAAQEIAARGYGEYGDVEEFLSDALSSIVRVTAKTTTRKRVKLGDAVKRVVKERQEIAQGQREPPGTPSSIPQLNAVLGGYRPGRVTLLVGASGIGKSALLMQELVEGAHPERGRNPALIISCEMGVDDLAVREIAADAEVDGRHVDAGAMSPREWLKVYKAASRLADIPVEVDEESIELPHVVASIRSWYADRVEEHVARVAAAERDGKTPPKMPALRVGVDYAQLVDGLKQKGETETDAQVRVSLALTRLSKELQIAIVVAGQYKKEYDGTREPRVNDIYGAGQWVKDAWTIVLLHVEQADIHKAIRPTRAIVAKNRGGETGPVDLDFHRARTRFFGRPEIL